MRKRIVVNAGLTETRVGVQEGNLLTELYLERHRHRSIVGSVYKGVVTNVLPGMQAAFVDIGLAKDAFLYAGDYTTNLGDLAGAMLAGGGEEGDVDLDVEELEPRRETAPIEDLLQKNQTVLVQVSKESLGTKGARITSFISLPGRYLVYMPQARHIGVPGRELLQARQGFARLLQPPGARVERADRRQRVGIVRRRFEHLLPRLLGLVGSRARLPIPGVPHQPVDDGVVGGGQRSRGGNHGGKRRGGQRVRPRHCLSHSVWRVPSASKRKRPSRNPPAKRTRFWS